MAARIDLKRARGATGGLEWCWVATEYFPVKTIALTWPRLLGTQRPPPALL